MKVCELGNEWLEGYKKEQIKRQSYVKYKSIVDNYINPHIGYREIDKINKRDVQQFVNLLKSTVGVRTKRPLSAATVNETLSVLKLMFNYAEDFELNGSNPVDKVKGVKKDYLNTTKCFTIEEQKRIENYCRSEGTIEGFCIVFDLYTGLRIGELLALEWEDIDFKTGTVSINKTLYISKDNHGEWKEIIDSPKTRSSIRTIPIPQSILSQLEEYEKNSNARRVFTRKNGRTVKPRTLRWRYNRMLDALHIEHKPFHTLRHTFATRAIELGIDVKTVSDILGHVSPRTTMEIYTHALNDHKRNAMEKMNSLMNQLEHE